MTYEPVPFPTETYRGYAFMCSLDGSFEGIPDSDDEPYMWRLLVLFLLPIAYGGIHLTA